MTSRMDCPRTASGDCSPIAHSTASVTFDLPEPLGPTTTDTPGPNSSFVRSGKDLKPLSVSDRRCTRSRVLVVGEHGGVGVQRLERDAGGLLLGVLFRAPGPAPDGRPSDRRLDDERAVVRRPLLVGDRVLDGFRAAG